MKNVVVKKGATVQYSIVDCDVTIGEDAVVGVDKSSEGADIAVVGCDLEVPAGTVIPGGAMVNAEKLSEILK
jgi:ADP-glucose pyrophosphorylase